MKVGFIGLGKLGYPVACCMAQGHEVIGFDVDGDRMQPGLYEEEGWWERDDSRFNLEFGDTSEMLRRGVELIFVAVPTPHQPEFEGITPTPKEGKDFDYRYLGGVLWDIDGRIEELMIETPPAVVIISTCSPGTIRGLMGNKWKDIPLVYNPSFIAMGSVMEDFWNAEMILIGAEHNGGHAAARRLAKFYGELFTTKDRTESCPPIYRCGTTEAEMVKLVYNTFITLKINWANHVMELCHQMNVDYGQVNRGLRHARQRLWSSAYTTGGMGDGGHCHPRDAHVMRFLEAAFETSSRMFNWTMHTRDAQARWKADIIARAQKGSRLMPVVLMGTDYKDNYPSKVGSDALLVRHYLTCGFPDGYKMDVYDFDETGRPEEPSIFLLCLDRDRYQTPFIFKAGDIIIDPWRTFRPNFPAHNLPGVKVIRLGERRE